MSLLGLDIGTKALQTNLLALEVTGQNIANVNNPNYTRQRARLEGDISIARSYGQVGTGVTVSRIEQVKDDFLDEQIRDQLSDFHFDAKRLGTYERMLNAFDEGEGFGLNQRLGELFNSFQELSNFPDDLAVKNGVLAEADLVANQITFLNDQLDQVRLDLDSEFRNTLTEANTALNTIAATNVEIVKIEAGGNSVAGDLRDKRDEAVKELAEYMNINVEEDANGSYSVTTLGRQLVFAGTTFNLSATTVTNDGLGLGHAVVSGTSDQLAFTGGKLGAILQSRDTDVTGEIAKLDTLAGTLIQELNKLHSDARGTIGYSSVTSAFAVNDITADLDSAGLALTPVNGQFNVVMIDSSGAETTATVTVDLDGSGSDDGLDDLATNITAAHANLTATANSDGTITLTTSGGYTVGFASDTSNVLAAVGLNHFYSGADASDITMNAVLSATPALLASGTSGNPGDNTVAKQMANLRDANLFNSNTQTFEGFYQNQIGDLGSAARKVDLQAEAGGLFLDQLELRRQSVSGVNLDEETANLIRFQSAMQAAARYVNTINEMLNVLVNGLV